MLRASRPKLIAWITGWISVEAEGATDQDVEFPRFGGHSRLGQLFSNLVLR